MRNKPGRLATAALAVLLLTGCAQNPPGVAAQVGDDRITDEQVDELAEALCVLNAGGEQQPTATSQQTRRQALELLINNELAPQLIDVDSVDRGTVAAERQRVAASLATLPERLREPFEDFYDDYVVSQLGLIELARDSLAEKGTKEPDQQAVLAEGQRLLLRHAARAKVAVDPRFGTFEEGRLAPGDGSLSVAVSDTAKASSRGDAVAADLPANLTCDAG